MTRVADHRAEATSILLQRHPEIETPATFAGLVEQLGGWITDGKVHNLPELDEIAEALAVPTPSDPADLSA